MTSGNHEATYVEADALHVIVPGRSWQNTELARVIEERAMPSPFRPHIPPGWGAKPHPLPKTFDDGHDLLLVTRHGMLHSQHRTHEALAAWMMADAWRAAYVDSVSSIVRERGPRIKVHATPEGLKSKGALIEGCARFCLRKLRFATDDEALTSADEALTAQAVAAEFQPADREAHLAHVVSIAAHVERDEGERLSVGAFADVAASRSAISGLSQGLSVSQARQAGSAKLMAERIYAKLTAQQLAARALR